MAENGLRTLAHPPRRVSASEIDPDIDEVDAAIAPCKTVFGERRALLLRDVVGIPEVQRKSKRPMLRRSGRCWTPRGEPHVDPDAVRRDVVQVRESGRMRPGVGSPARGVRAEVPLDPAGRQSREPRRVDPLGGGSDRLAGRRREAHSDGNVSRRLRRLRDDDEPSSRLWRFERRKGSRLS